MNFADCGQKIVLHAWCYLVVVCLLCASSWEKGEGTMVGGGKGNFGQTGDEDAIHRKARSGTSKAQCHRGTYIFVGADTRKDLSLHIWVGTSSMSTSSVGPMYISIWQRRYAQFSEWKNPFDDAAHSDI